jgi:hypothetical protein
VGCNVNVPAVIPEYPSRSCDLDEELSSSNFIRDLLSSDHWRGIFSIVLVAAWFINILGQVSGINICL